MSCVLRKPAFCIYEDKGADQLRDKHAADQRLCFRKICSTLTLLSKSEISILKQSSVVVQPSMHLTWSETPKTGFVVTLLTKTQIRPGEQSRCIFCDV